MLLGRKLSTTEYIITILADGALDTLELLALIRQKKPLTKQGFYRALGELVDQETVVKNKQLVFLNNAWVNKLHQFVQVVDENYQLSQAKESFLNLNEGESLVYYFRSVASLDALWMHYFFLIMKKEPGEVIYYDPHDWFSLCRPEAQEFMYSWLKSHKRRGFTVIGSDTPLDRKTTGYMKSEYMQVAYEAKSSFRKTLYITVIGQYVIDAIIDSVTADAIERVYRKYTEADPELTSELRDIVSRLKRSKVVITRNKKRAEKIRKKLMKYFTFYK